MPVKGFRGAWFAGVVRSYVFVAGNLNAMYRPILF